MFKASALMKFNRPASTVRTGPKSEKVGSVPKFALFWFLTNTQLFLAPGWLSAALDQCENE